jgi:hypothetical protein
LSEEEERRNRFEGNRSGYYSAFIAFCLMDITQTALRSGLFDPVWYLPFVAHFAVLAAGGLVVRKRGYDRFFAWYQLIVLLLWALVVRRYLVSDSITEG